MKKALYPGSFDPPTLGHLNIIERAAKLFNRLYIGIGENPSKKASFTLDERKEMLKKMTKKCRNVEIVTFSGLTSETAKKLKVDVLIRSLRGVSDFDYEVSLCLMNRIHSGFETLFLVAEGETRYISSTLVTELAKERANITPFVPKEIAKIILDKF